MDAEPPKTSNDGRKALLIGLPLAALVAFLIVFGAVLPAQFGMDPLGLGKLTGLDRLGAANVQVSAENAAYVEMGPEGAALAHEYPATWRTDTIEIPLTGMSGGPKMSELEYKVQMKKGAALLFDWEVTGAATDEDLYFDFHGHTTDAKPPEPNTVATYKQGKGLKRHGSLTAPFDGIHGWYLRNETNAPIVVRIKLAGYYELVTLGAEGNLVGIKANVPAAEARSVEPDNYRR